MRSMTVVQKILIGDDPESDKELRSIRFVTGLSPDRPSDCGNKSE